MEQETPDHRGELTRILESPPDDTALTEDLLELLHNELRSMAAIKSQWSTEGTFWQNGH